MLRCELISHRRSANGAFTTIELVVVVALIALILAITVPALSTMARDARRTDALQKMDASLTRAKYIAIEDRGAALRMLPSQWDWNEEEGLPAKVGNQHVAIFSVGVGSDEYNPSDPVQLQRFQRRADISSSQLPSGVWLAPLEATFDENIGVSQFADISEEILTGTLATAEAGFAFSADPDENEDFLIADDFLVAFDANGALVPGPRGIRSLEADPNDLGDLEYGHRYLHWLEAYAHPEDADERGLATRKGDDRDWRDDELYERYNFSGVVLYDRESFVALGADADPEDRRDFLRDRGQPLYVHPTGAVLVEARQRQE